MKCACLIFLMMFTLSKQVVASTPEWNVGTVVLDDNEIRIGAIAVEHKHHMILFKNGDRVEVLAAHRLRSVQFYDAKANVNRKFISIADKNLYGVRSQLFEVVVNGEVLVLRKQKSFVSQQISDAGDFEYYFFAHDEMTALRKFRAKVYPKLVQNAELVRYIKQEKLNPNISADALLIVDYYNQVFKNGFAISSR